MCVIAGGDIWRCVRDIELGVTRMPEQIELSREELIELLAFAYSNIDSQFELWLTITFAVIIASYIAGHRLARWLRYSFAVLYTLVSVLLLLMLYSVVRTSQTLIGEPTIFIGPDSGDPLMLTIIVLRNVRWLIGTVVTVLFILRGFRERDKSQN